MNWARIVEALAWGVLFYAVLRATNFSRLRWFGRDDFVPVTLNTWSQVERVSVAEVSESDIIVLATPAHVSRDVVETLKEQGREVFGVEKVAVLTGGVQLEAVLRRPLKVIQTDPALFTKGELKAIRDGLLEAGRRDERRRAV